MEVQSAKDNDRGGSGAMGGQSSLFLGLVVREGLLSKVRDKTKT